MLIEELIQGDNFNDYLYGPFWRAWISGPIIFITWILTALVPGLNFLSSYYLGLLALKDYYGDTYVPFAGAKLPTNCDNKYRTRRLFLI